MREVKNTPKPPFVSLKKNDEEKKQKTISRNALKHLTTVHGLFDVSEVVLRGEHADGELRILSKIVWSLMQGIIDCMNNGGISLKKVFDKCFFEKVCNL